VQTAADMILKVKEQADACRCSLEILRLDTTRAEHDYDQYSAATPLEYDRKDNLLAYWRNFDDQYAARKFQCDKLIPSWHRVAAALQALAEALKK
jgi:hypothetical protein